MGLVVKREMNLEKLFNDLAVDPKKKAKQEPDKKPKDEKKASEDKK
jgi:hypothetical protein